MFIETELDSPGAQKRSAPLRAAANIAKRT